MTKKAELLTLLQRRWVSPMDALELVHCFSLAQRVSEFRASGLKIKDRWVMADGSRFKEYRMERER